MQAMAVTSTVWPIAFAAIVGPLLKALALYKAERGTKLGSSQQVQLSTSSTLVSTLRGILTLRLFSLWFIVLLAIWAFSPTGGQGALRAIELEPNSTSFEYSVIVYPTNNLSAFDSGTFNSGASGYGSLMSQFLAAIGAMFSSPDAGLLHANGSSPGFKDAVNRAGGVQQAVKSTQRDLWRNVRVPFLHLLPGYNRSKPYDWVEVPTDSIASYSSLIGIPLRGMPSSRIGNSTIHLQTNYLSLSCSPWEPATAVGLYLNRSAPSPGDSGLPNTVVQMLHYDSTLFPAYEPPPTEPSGKMSLYFGNVIGIIRNSTTCEMSTAYVESVVACNSTSDSSELDCFVSRMHHIQGLPVEGNYTPLAIGRNFEILDQIPYTLASLHPAEASGLEKYLKDPPTIFGTEHTWDGYQYVDVPMDVFQNRLALVLNTFLFATLNATNIFGADGVSLRGRDSTWANTTGTWTEFTPQVYRLNNSWFILYFASTLVLTVCALANIVLRSMIRAPDILGSVSALTRDSLFIETPTPASFLDGTERARYLKDKWVKIQDVNPEEEVGRIAFSDEGSFAPLRRGREYE